MVVKVPAMPARGKIDLEKVKASLSTFCPHCGHEIAPAELRRIDFDQVLCPRVKQPSRRGNPKGSRLHVRL